MVNTMRKPDFIIVGAAKCGTTSLATTLAQTPGIFVTNPKEPEYYQIDKPSQQDSADYYALYEDANTQDILGEASTVYTRYPTKGENTFKNIYHDNPKIKLIYVLREPIKRTYSEYCQQQSNQMRFGAKEELSYAEAVQKFDYIVDTSMYAKQLQQMLTFFPKEQILLVDFDTLTCDSESELERIFNFLQLTRSPPKNLAYDNSTKKQFEDIELGATQEKISKNALLNTAKNFIPSKVKHSIYDFMKNAGLVEKIVGDTGPSALDTDTAVLVYRAIKDDIELFSNLTGFDISSWIKTWETNGWAK